MSQWEFYVFVKDGKLMIRHPEAGRDPKEKNLSSIKAEDIQSTVEGVLNRFKKENRSQWTFLFYLLPDARNLIGEKKADQIALNCKRAVKKHNDWALSH
ncbi:hypothetical protein COV17_00950 [Candidatus Woesearchaeota archaeon CG10_big_fil_rev_8_21_14_0_10_36_11]|nr:MAG: hypothetical protein COV17_00950 [Candidatus Woesearchaeota archaeon CG10_big_fil_rev_8_21_14_0_10_36_11]